MGFYIRKSFTTGPIRFNLSKGGMGISGGVKGARLGISSRGQAYVHGGRGGLYYRKTLGTGRSSGAGAGAATRDAVELVQDTGVTYGSAPDDGQRSLTDEMAPPASRQRRVLTLCGVAVLGLLIFGASLAAGVVAVAGAALLGLGVARRRAGQRYGRSLDGHLRDLTPLSAGVAAEIRRVRDRRMVAPADVRYLQHHAYLNLLEAAVAGAPRPPDPGLIAQVEALFELDSAFCHQARLDGYRRAWLAAVSDHDLTEDEERELDRARSVLGLTEGDLAEEMSLLNRLRDVRAMRTGDLPQVTPSRSLPRNESCHLESDGRLLKQRILQTFRREGRSYKVRGFVIDKEGTLLITNKRLLLIHARTTSIPLGRIRDLEVDYDRKLLIIAKEGAVNPVYLTTPLALEAGAMVASLTGS